MATKIANVFGTAADGEWRVHPDEQAPDGGVGPIAGVLHGGRAATAKRIEVTFYALIKQGGGLIAIWYALTHSTGWVEWSGFALFYVLGILSMSLCYHRYFNHRAFETSRPMQYVLGIWGQLGAYGSLRNWCIDHRRHHGRSDRPGDVHSPHFDEYGRPISGRKGFRHSHLGWLWDDSTTDPKIYGKGLIDDPVVTFCHHTRMFWFVISFTLIPAAWGFFLGGPDKILSTILIAGCLRMSLNLQFIALVNSAGHTWGRQRFKGEGTSQNNWFIAILTLGEGWHNNHHAHPRAANAGMAWYEIDMTNWVIWVFEKLGLVWNVNRVKLAEVQPAVGEIPATEPAEAAAH
jgi:stearoyl-CoA desaturase (delta-9 desaturase)